jgi:hypothetical protein
MSVQESGCVVSTTLFLILLIVTCATIVPQVYVIGDNTATLKGEPIVTDLELLHEDLVFMQSQLNIFAAELVAMNSSLAEMNANIDTLVNGERLEAFTIRFAKTAATYSNLLGKIALQ